MNQSLVGNLYVIAAPSGTGKTTLVHELTQTLSQITISISHTTRPKRSEETDGIDYHFVSEKTFRAMIDRGDFLEYATVFNYLYGTSRLWVEEKLSQGLDVVLEIDWQGCQSIKKLFPSCISIFILPPSLSSLHERLLKRNQDHPEIIQQRLLDVNETVSHVPEFDFIVVNDDFSKAVNDLKTIVQAERLIKSRQMVRHATLIAELLDK